MSVQRQNLAPRRRPGLRKRRGSILLLVLVLLIALLLLATLLAYLSRLDARAAENAALSVQARMASASGVAGARRLLARYEGKPIAYTQKWSQPAPLLMHPDEALHRDEPLVAPVAESVAAPPGPTPLADKPTSPPSPDASAAPAAFAGRIEIEDQSARIDVNALMPIVEERSLSIRRAMPAVAPRLPSNALERLIASCLSRMGSDAAKAREMTQSILAARWQTDAPVDPLADDQSALPASGASRPPPHPPAPAPRGAAAPHMAATVPGREPQESERSFRPIRNLGEIKTVARMPDALWEAVAPHLTTFSSCSEDWRPRDAEENVPRVPLNTASPEEIYEALRLAYPQAPDALLRQFAVNLVDRRDADSVPTVYDDGGAQTHPAIGYEKTVVISEVCPDTITPREHGDNGEYVEIFNPLDKTVDLTSWTLQWGESQARLDLSLPPGAILIVTDDVKDDRDPTPEDDQPGIGSFYDVFKILPYNDKTLILEAPNMNIPDESGVVRLLDDQGRLIDYLAYESAAFDGINRGFQKRTPFSRRGVRSEATPFKADIADPPTLYERYCRDILAERMDGAFETVAEVLAVPAAPPVDPDGRWVFPAIDRPGSAELGLLLLDCLTESDAPGPSLGKINLNTAARPVLEVLPGLDLVLVNAILDRRAQIEADARATGSEAAPFVSLSDFAGETQVWSGKNPAQRLESLLALCPLVTTTSNAFSVTTTAFADPGISDPGASGLAARALVNMRNGAAQIVAWDIAPPD